MKELWTAFLFAGIGGCTVYTTSPLIVEEPTSLLPAASVTPTRSAASLSASSPPPAAAEDPTPSAESQSVHSPVSEPQCDAVKFADLIPCEYYDLDAEVEDIGDLDGDGRTDVAVTYNTSMTSRGVTILRRTGDRTCFTEVYSGTGFGVSLKPQTTRGWRDIELVFEPLTSQGRGIACVRAAFDGTKYRWAKALSCSDITGKDLSRSECEEIMTSYDPDK